MAKGVTFVVLYSIVLLILFGVFCYLMTTVNPAPISSDVSDTDSAFEDYLPTIREGIVRFGLEKYHSLREGDDVDRETVSTERPYILFVKQKTTKVFEPISTSSDHLDLKPSTAKSAKELVDKMTMGIKKGKRRSVNENLHSKIEQSGAVILKILDDTGNTKIEIKVEPDAFNANDIKDFTYYKNKREYKNRDTVIKVLPNNTLHLANPGSAVLIDFARKNTIISKEVTERQPNLNTRPYTTTSSIILQTLKNDKLVLFSATNSTEKYVTNSKQSS